MTDRAGALDCDVTLRSPQSGTLAVEDDTLVLSGRNREQSGVAGALRFEARARLLPTGGRLEPRAGGIGVRGADALTILIAIATSYRRFDDVSGDPSAATRAAIAAASPLGFAKIAADASAEHQRLYRSVKLDLGQTAAAERPTDERIRTSESADDPALATLYFNYGRYLLIASSRPGGQAANLQGVWNELLNPPWESKYTTNINCEMNYWPAELTNLSECHEPLFDMIDDLRASGARTAKKMYHSRGWVLHHNTDLWRGTAPINNIDGMWPTGGAWLCYHLWEHYLFSGDKDFLAKRAYPAMKEASEFFLDFLVKDRHAKYRSLLRSGNGDRQFGAAAFLRKKRINRFQEE